MNRTVVVVAEPYTALERKVRQRVQDGQSHRRVAAVLTEVAVAAIHPARDLGVGRSASWGSLQGPIEGATQAAVETLSMRLAQLVETLPRSTVDELAREQVVAELGIE